MRNSPSQARSVDGEEFIVHVDQSTVLRRKRVVCDRMTLEPNDNNREVILRILDGVEIKTEAV